MGKLSERKTRLSFQTADEVRERGRYRAVIIEAHPQYAMVRLQGMRKAFMITYAAVYSTAVKMEVAAQREAKKAAKKARAK